MSKAILPPPGAPAATRYVRGVGADAPSHERVNHFQTVKSTPSAP
jgi:hypothetical protein